MLDWLGSDKIWLSTKHHLLMRVFNIYEIYEPNLNNFQHLNLFTPLGDQLGLTVVQPFISVYVTDCL